MKQSPLFLAGKLGRNELLNSKRAVYLLYMVRSNSRIPARMHISQFLKHWYRSQMHALQDKFWFNFSNFLFLFVLINSIFVLSFGIYERRDWINISALLFKRHIKDQSVRFTHSNVKFVFKHTCKRQCTLQRTSWWFACKIQMRSICVIGTPCR